MKRGYILSPGDLFQGFIAGLIVGIIVCVAIYFMMNGTIHNPFFSTPKKP